MKLKPFRIIPFFILSLSLSLSALAQTFYPAMGHIEQLTDQQISLGDFQYKLLSTSKVTLLNKKQGKLSDLKTGDFVGVTLITINNRQLVDSIVVLNLP